MNNFSALFLAEFKLDIAASRAAIWDALTNPALVKQYFFGTDLSSTWQLGEMIYFRGEFDGKPYEDKGIIKAITPEHFLQYSYFSSWSEKEDREENYRLISYELVESPDNPHHHTLHIKQECDTEEQRDHSAQNWASVMNVMKALVEKK
jgi:uncharacterized protein YndB with AHSA1/START domain